MKKIIAYMISVMVIFLLITSCGKNEEQIQTLENAGSYSSVAEWIEKESENIEGLKESMAGTDLELNIVDKDKSLVYQYRFIKVSGEDAVLRIKQQLEADIEMQKDSMNAVLVMLRKEVPNADSVIFEYYDKDNNLITSCEIK